jgi:hypothetical protein
LDASTACGEAKSNLETCHEYHTNYIGIGGTAFIVNATSTLGEGKAGYVMTAKSTEVCELLDDRDNKAIELYFKAKGGSINQATVRFHFKPHVGLSDIITIDKPLKDFNIRDFHRADPEWKVASLPAKAIWAGRAGVANLRKVSLIVEKNGSLLLGNIEVSCGGNGPFPRMEGVSEVITSIADCSAQ